MSEPDKGMKIQAMKAELPIPHPGSRAPGTPNQVRRYFELYHLDIRRRSPCSLAIPVLDGAQAFGSNVVMAALRRERPDE
jgi:hypothetical protein